MTLLAREKLDEAQYFLDLMTETKAKPEFRFNLSAFLSAARSVTIYLQKQYTGQPEFDEWYEEKQQEMRDSSLFEAMKEARNHTLKESYPRIQELYVETTSIDEISEISIRASGINSGDILRESAPHIDIPGDDVEIQKVGCCQTFSMKSITVSHYVKFVGNILKSLIFYFQSGKFNQISQNR